ncbi:MAG: DUF1893 domain-containing protein [Spirochaetes bacterium]|nr:DUF1893 domain-containing protein [Spirochaetota bacterium]
MNDLEKAVNLLKTENYTCVLVKKDSTYTSIKDGISPVIDFIDSGIDLKGYSAADKIVGKAAAMLFVLTGVKEVFGSVMSTKAESILSQYGIEYSNDILAEYIINRQGTGPCPMEKAVKDIDDPASALKAVRQTLKELQKTQK